MKAQTQANSGPHTHSFQGAGVGMVWEQEWGPWKFLVGSNPLPSRH